MKIDEYEIVDKIGDEENYEYEEITVGELLNRCDLSEEEKNEFVRKKFSVNIHVLVSLETYDWIMETLNDSMTDERLSKLNAIVLLSLKKRGRGKNFTSLPQDKFKQLVDFALDHNISIGFDSCSCIKLLESVKNHKNYKQFYQCSDPCESSLFSFFSDYKGKMYPCSFCDGQEKWEDGIDVVNCNDFVKDVWYNPRIVEFRNNLIKTADKNDLKCRTCPMFEV